MKIVPAALVFVFGATCAVLDAAQVELKNGDRVSGELVSQSDSSVTLSSPLFGELEIPMDVVAKVIADTGDAKEEKSVEEVAATPPPPPPPPPAEEGMPKEHHLPGVEGIRNATSAFLSFINLSDNWNSNFIFSMSVLTGQTNSRSSKVGFNTERKWTRQSLRFELSQEYEVTETDGEDNVTRDSFKTLARYRHDISKKMFFESNTQYMYAKVKGIDHDVRQSLGLGWHIIQTEKFNFSLTPSVTGQYTVLEGGDDNFSCAPTIYQELSYQWTDSINIHQEASALFPVTGDADPSYHFATTLKNNFMKNLFFNVEYLFDYDGTVLEGTDASQHSFRVGLGMNF